MKFIVFVYFPLHLLKHFEKLTFCHPNGVFLYIFKQLYCFFIVFIFFQSLHVFYQKCFFFQKCNDLCIFGVIFENPRKLLKTLATDFENPRKLLKTFATEMAEIEDFFVFCFKFIILIIF